jgi:hypothetical protein
MALGTVHLGLHFNFRSRKETTMKLLQALLILGAGLGSLSMIAPARAEPSYRYCMTGTPNMGRDCTFTTLQQCQATASGGIGFCHENAAYVANARQTTPMPKRR